MNRLLILLIMSLLVINTSAAKDNIVILGDSLSAGYGIKQEENWVSLLQNRLDKEYPQYRIINASISGDTSANGLYRLANALQQHTPKIIIIELGANDGLRGLPIKYAKNNLEKIIQLSQKTSAKILLIGMRIPPNYGKKYTEAFAKIYPNLEEQYNLPLVPFMLDGVAGNSSLMQLDGLHPNAKAQSKILDNIWPYLAAILTKL